MGGECASKRVVKLVMKKAVLLDRENWNEEWQQRTGLSLLPVATPKQ
jgi:hypothetical protein